MLKAILFDLGDTLFDFGPVDTRLVTERAARSTHEFLAARGHSLPPLRRYFRRQYWAVRRAYLWSRLRGREFNAMDVLRRQCAAMGLELDEATIRELAWKWYEPLTDMCRVADDVTPTLEELSRCGLKLAIVSNTFIPGFVLDRHMEMHNLLRFFPVRVYSSEVGYRKPHPRIFRAALDALGVRAAESAFIGDLVRADIVGARRVGMLAVLRHRSAGARPHRLAHHAVSALSELLQILPVLSRLARHRAREAGAGAHGG